MYQFKLIKYTFSIYFRENKIDIGLRFLIPNEHKQKIFEKNNYLRTDYGYLNKFKAKENENQRIMPLVNIIKRMDSVLNSFQTNE